VSAIEKEAVPRVACFATQGPASLDEDRIKYLLGPLAPEVVTFRRGRRLRSAASLWRAIRALDPDVTVMEGTGIGGGLVLLALRALFGMPYIVSSGDAIAPFLAARSSLLGLAAHVYERSLCRRSSGFIGWSPYLVGRALTYGAPRAMTSAHWAQANVEADGATARKRLQIPDEAIVFGVVGSLNWNPRLGYCYGLELVKAACAVQRGDLRVLIVGDGNGRAHLEELAGDRLDRSILIPGRVPHSEVGNYLRAMDVASLPQSVDGVGAFRYTMKLSEYLAVGLPIVTGQIPLAYDLDEGWLWRLPGDAPWDATYLAALASLMRTVTREEVSARRPAGAPSPLFDAAHQQKQVCQFVVDVAERERRRSEPATA
jgi:glycosyltransferase involved in cell wall biosynthesis